MSAYCRRCDRYFPHMRALGNHERDSAQHNICYECGIDFSSWLGLKEHFLQSPRHHYCQQCNSHFGDDELYLEHLETSHWACKQHRRIFANDHGLNEHYRQHAGHVYCELCQRYCPETGDLWSHANSHHYTCPQCNTFCLSEADIKAHKQTNHLYCAECDKYFISQANMEAHLNSRRHAPAVIRCPGAQCGRSFVKPSDLVQHFEAGTCASGMTRTGLNQEVVRRDRNNVITNPNRLLTGPDGSHSVPNDSYLATERSWNGRAFECFLCSRDFASLNGLNQHLQSPAHAAKIFRCPNGQCLQQYSALSALVQHVECDRCGIRQDPQVQGVLNGVVSGMPRIAY